MFSPSALARSPDMHRLLVFAQESGLLPSWLDPQALGVSACVTGNTLDQAIGSDMLDGQQANLEMLIHLESPRGRCTVNLATVLALATAYISEQYERLESFLNPTVTVCLAAPPPLGTEVT